MSALEQVLKLRPSSIAARLAGTKVCLLNPRDVHHSLPQRPVVVCECPAAPIAAGVFRAARQAASVVGLTFPSLPRAEPPRPAAVVQAILKAAVEAGYEHPWFLRAGPVAIHEATQEAVAEAREAVYRLVDAGFTEVCLDVTGLDPAEAAAAVAEAAMALRERELSIDVTTRDAQPDQLLELVASLGAQGVRVDVLSLPASALAGATDLSAHLAALRPAGLALVDAGDKFPATGVRRLVVSSRLTRIAMNALPPEAQKTIRSRAVEGWSVPGAIAAAVKATPPSFEVQLKMEALAYHEVLDLLERAGGEASGLASVASLAEHSGY